MIQDSMDHSQLMVRAVETRNAIFVELPEAFFRARKLLHFAVEAWPELESEVRCRVYANLSRTKQILQLDFCMGFPTADIWIPAAATIC